MTNQPADKFVLAARERIARSCDAGGHDLRARLYRNGSNDQQPELLAMASLLRNLQVRPLDELLAEDGA